MKKNTFGESKNESISAEDKVEVLSRHLQQGIIEGQRWGESADWESIEWALERPMLPTPLAPEDDPAHYEGYFPHMDGRYNGIDTFFQEKIKQPEYALMEQYSETLEGYVGVPNALLHAFEKGWSLGVRRYHDSNYHSEKAKAYRRKKFKGRRWWLKGKKGKAKRAESDDRNQSRRGPDE